MRASSSVMSRSPNLSTFRRDAIATSPFASARTSTVRATWSNGSSIGSNSVGGSRRVTTNLRPTTWPSFSSHQYGCGFVLMSPRPRSDGDRSVLERPAMSQERPDHTRHLGGEGDDANAFSSDRRSRRSGVLTWIDPKPIPKRRSLVSRSPHSMLGIPVMADRHSI